MPRPMLTRPPRTAADPEPELRMITALLAGPKMPRPRPHRARQATIPIGEAGMNISITRLAAEMDAPRQTPHPVRHAGREKTASAPSAAIPKPAGSADTIRPVRSSLPCVPSGLAAGAAAERDDLRRCLSAVTRNHRQDGNYRRSAHSGAETLILCGTAPRAGEPWASTSGGQHKRRTAQASLRKRIPTARSGHAGRGTGQAAPVQTDSFWGWLESPPRAAGQRRRDAHEGAAARRGQRGR